MKKPLESGFFFKQKRTDANLRFISSYTFQTSTERLVDEGQQSGC